MDIGEATPIYDMLPMAYMPRQGELMNPEWQTPRFIPVSESAKTIAQEVAIKFWQTVLDNPDISADFKGFVQSIKTELKIHP